MKLHLIAYTAVLCVPTHITVCITDICIYLFFFFPDEIIWTKWSSWSHSSACNLHLLYLTSGRLCKTREIWSLNLLIFWFVAVHKLSEEAISFWIFFFLVDRLFKRNKVCFKELCQCCKFFQSVSFNNKAKCYLKLYFENLSLW